MVQSFKDFKIVVTDNFFGDPILITESCKKDDKDRIKKLTILYQSRVWIHDGEVKKLNVDINQMLVDRLKEIGHPLSDEVIGFNTMNQSYSKKENLIELSDNDKELILICKMHLQDKYPFKGSWHATLVPWFEENYAWNPLEDNNYQDYLQGMFMRLFAIHMKIRFERTDNNRDLLGIFSDTFYKGISNDSEFPIERAIHSLCGLIQFNLVVDKGVQRYDLNVKGTASRCKSKLCMKITTNSNGYCNGHTEEANPILKDE